MIKQNNIKIMHFHKNLAKHAFVCCFHPTTEAAKIHNLLAPYSKKPK